LPQLPFLLALPPFMDQTIVPYLSCIGTEDRDSIGHPGTGVTGWREEQKEAKKKDKKN